MSTEFNLPRSRWPVFADDEVDAVTQVLRSGKVNQWTGPDVGQFEQEFSEYIGSPAAIAVANGTLSLELALRVAGVGVGHEVVVTPRSFVASASVVLNVGATPVFADVDRRSGNVTAESIRSVLRENTRAIIPVHLAGWPCDMAGIMALADAHNLIVIEDCAQAHGATIDGQRVGSFGQFGSFSFCQDKIMSTGGEGGLLTVNDERFYEAAWSYKDHGKNQDKAKGRIQLAPGYKWLHDGVGTNWRLTGMQAAIGSTQLRKLPHWLEARAQNARVFMDVLAGSGKIDFPMPEPNVGHAYYRLYGYISDAAFREQLLSRCEKAGIALIGGTCSELYREGVFENQGLSPEQALPNAAWMMQHSIMLQVDQTLSTDEAREIAEAIKQIMLEIE